MGRQYKNKSFENTCKNLEKDGWIQEKYETGNNILFYIEQAVYSRPDNNIYKLFVDYKGTCHTLNMEDK